MVLQAVRPGASGCTQRLYLTDSLKKSGYTSYLKKKQNEDGRKHNKVKLRFQKQKMTGGRLKWVNRKEEPGNGVKTVRNPRITAM